ncbi:hypothetical protein, partial [Phaeodactylibacter xiamenensis]|uniref:hypothetical protein n=1 Tax=Phaeodactylibacter xiamenensis TaxID=1524460 RepID=UPI001EE7277C
RLFCKKGIKRECCEHWLHTSRVKSSIEKLEKRVRCGGQSQATPISPLPTAAILVKWDEKIIFRNPGLRVARAVHRQSRNRKRYL